MQRRKIRVGIIFGGKSPEHEVSLQTAKKVIESIDVEKYEVVLIGIDRSGKWLLPDHSQYLLHGDDPTLIAINKAASKDIVLLPQGEGSLVDTADSSFSKGIDVAFPVLHGQFGEDGTVQGFLKLADIPFVGAGVLGSAVGMDKDVMKRLLRDAGLPIADFITCTSKSIPTYSDVVQKLGQPFFVKPANAGSSMGVSKVKSEEGFDAAVKDAFLYDRKILIEEYIQGRELECGVIGNDEPIASRVGEIIPKEEFYSYAAKYTDEDAVSVDVPANIPQAVERQIQEHAVQTFKTLGCEGMARVDFFLKEDGKLVINEINTIPGPVMFRRI
jgi:D-alanine-D-alanine ligase